ncbi:hypothetical protein HAX54_022134 [Datura stramonium]|uniref:Uncharacterized protein n=1 Tax=Datura stramonium TaxID=4076 RepID=A0ABS8UTQ8_DATST|nr:hypothetical protein [Datura stramonium]
MLKISLSVKDSHQQSFTRLSRVKKNPDFIRMVKLESWAKKGTLPNRVEKPVRKALIRLETEKRSIDKNGRALEELRDIISPLFINVVKIRKKHSNLNVAGKIVDKNPEVDNLQHHTEGCVRTGKPLLSPNQYDHVMQRFEQCMGANSELNFNEKHDIVQQVENSIVMN